MALSEKERKQLLVFLIVLALAGPVLLWMTWRKGIEEQINAKQTQIDSLETVIDSARAVLARGSVANLRQLTQDYESSLNLMRQLVPGQNELPNLIDDVSARGRLRGIQIRQLDVMATEDLFPFKVYRYNFEVTGTYDQVGEFLSDIASLPRIMVPYGLRIEPSSAGGITGTENPGAPVQASFQLRTFVRVGGSDGGSGAAP